MVANSFSTREVASSINQTNADHNCCQATAVHGAYRQGESAGAIEALGENINTGRAPHVLGEDCVTLQSRLIGSEVHRPASSIPIGYQQKHPLQPHTVSQTQPGPSAAVPGLTTHLLQMGGGDGDSHPLQQKTTRTILSICGQTNIRVYNRYVLCFPLSGGAETRPRIDAHIRDSLRTLAEGRPEFAGRLELAANVKNHKHEPKSGYICLKQSPSFRIPFEPQDLAAEFGWTFSSLRDEGFPAKAFVHPRFEIPCDVTEKGDLPAARVRALYIEGGLLLGVWLHHGLADGSGVGEFLDAFAAATRGDGVGASRCLELDLMPYQDEIGRIAGNKTFNQLLEECPEYGAHRQLSNPTGAIERDGGTPVADIEKTGKIFVFSRKRLEEIKTAVNRYLRPDSSGSSSSSDSPGGASCYVCLAALTWAHAAKARLEVERFGPQSSCHEITKMARLMNPVNWKPRALQAATRDYYGNATALAITKVPVPLLIKACEDPTMEALAMVVGRIKSTVNAIDDEFVCRRLATYYAASDPRYLGLDIDPRTQQDLGFNTWRDFGGDAEWCFPGMERTKAEAVRRAQGGWNMAGSLILPARKGSDVYELIVTLPQVSMERLLKDEGYTSNTIRITD